MGKTNPRGGVLARQELQKLVNSGTIKSENGLDGRQLQPASIDLRLSQTAWRMQASFLSGREKSIADGVNDLSMAYVDLRERQILERSCIYLAELQEVVAIPEGLTGKANPKSTTGRLDVFTRLVTEGNNRFDQIRAGYAGRLYAEIVPRAFPIIAQAGTALLQLRLVEGECAIEDDALQSEHAENPLAWTNSEPVRPGHFDGGLNISVRLESNDDSPVAYRARPNTPCIDMAARNRYEPENFWEPIRPDSNGKLILNPGDFYLLGSAETVRIGPDQAAEMVPYDPAVGEFRIHYAGFFDPGFGNHADGTGTPAVLEVRAHETAFALEHGQTVGRLVYNRMRKRPDMMYGQNAGSSYASQTLAFAKQFRRTGKG